MSQWRPLNRLFASILGVTGLGLLGPAVMVFYVASMLGDRSVSAVSALTPLLLLISLFIAGFSRGAANLISRSRAANDNLEVKRAASAILGVTAVFGGMVSLFGALGTRFLMRLLQTPPTVLDEAVWFSTVILVGFPARAFYVAYTSMLNSAKLSALPLLGSIVNVATMLSLTPLLLSNSLIEGGFGVLGAAYAYTVANCISVLTILWFAREEKAWLVPSFSWLRTWVNGRAVIDVLHNGMPLGIQMAAAALAQVALSVAVNVNGWEATAAFGLSKQVLVFTQSAAIAAGIVSMIFVSQVKRGTQNFQPEEVAGIAGRSFLVWLLGAAVISLLVAELILGNVSDDYVRSLSREALLLMMVAYVPLGYGEIFSGCSRGLGQPVIPSLIEVLVIWVVQLPLALLFLESFGVLGIWLSFPVAYGLLFLAQWAFYRRTLNRLLKKSFHLAS